MNTKKKQGGAQIGCKPSVRPVICILLGGYHSYSLFIRVHFCFVLSFVLQMSFVLISSQGGFVHRTDPDTQFSYGSCIFAECENKGVRYNSSRSRLVWVTTNAFTVHAPWSAHSARPYIDRLVALSHTDSDWWSLHTCLAWLQLSLFESVLSFPQLASILVCMIFQVSWWTSFLTYVAHLTRWSCKWLVLRWSLPVFVFTVCFINLLIIWLVIWSQLENWKARHTEHGAF